MKFLLKAWRIAQFWLYLTFTLFFWLNSKKVLLLKTTLFNSLVFNNKSASILERILATKAFRSTCLKSFLGSSSSFHLRKGNLFFLLQVIAYTDFEKSFFCFSWEYLFSALTCFWNKKKTSSYINQFTLNAQTQLKRNKLFWFGSTLILFFFSKKCSQKLFTNLQIKN